MKLFGYGGQEPMSGDELQQAYAELGIGAGPPLILTEDESDTVSDSRLAVLAHSEDKEKRRQCAKRAFEAIHRGQYDAD